MANIPKRVFRVLRDEGARTLLERSIYSLELNTIGRTQYYQSVAPRIYNKLRSFDVDEYEPPCEPYKIIHVNPDDISEVSRRPVPIDRRSFGQVRDGDWDIRDDFVYTEPDHWHAETYESIQYEDYIFHQSLKRHFDEGVPWKDTEFVQLGLEYIDNGYSLWKGCSSEQELFERAEQVDRIYRSIRRRGYQPYYELETRRLPHSRRHEIQIDIGRTGELLFVEGRHRLSIAKILDVEEIPVVVLTRHTNWMKRRDRAYQSGLREHPDFTEW